MSVSAYPTPVRFGFLGLCEGALLGLLVGWWLQTHFYPPMIYFGAGVAVAAAYYFLLSIGRGSALAAPIVILSMLIWGIVGWNLGGYIFKIFAISRSGVSMLDTVMAWKIVAALVFAFIAYNDKASISER